MWHGLCVMLSEAGPYGGFLRKGFNGWESKNAEKRSRCRPAGLFGFNIRLARVGVHGIRSVAERFEA
jgi:hypothetical protein